MKPPFINPKTLGVDLQGFYGNRVKKFMSAVCECGKTYIALLALANNGYKIIDLAEEVEKRVEKKEENAPDPLDLLSRKDLVDLARKYGFEGNASSTKSKDLKEFIKIKT